MITMPHLTRAYPTPLLPLYDTFARVSLCPLLILPVVVACSFSFIRAVSRFVLFILITVYCKLLLLECTFSLP